MVPDETDATPKYLQMNVANSISRVASYQQDAEPKAVDLLLSMEFMIVDFEAFTLAV